MHECRDCHKTWRGYKPEHCTVCHETFGGSTGGDRHRAGKHGVKEGLERRRCRTAEEMLDVGMSLNAKGIWIVEVTQEDWSK